MTRTPIAGAVLAVALAVAACGGGQSGPQVAGSGGGGGTTAAAPTSTDPQDSLLGFAQCMRQHGVNIPDPRPGQGQITMPTGIPSERLQPAMQACQTYLSQGLGKNPDDPAAQDRALKEAQCLRQHGFDVADPQPGSPLTVHGANAKDPRFTQAVQDCKHG
jgi:hypothetical protein